MIDFVQAQSLWETLPDLEQVTLCARTSATTPGGQDTFTAYTLYHVKRKPATRRQLEIAGLNLSDESVTFDLYQDDLNACGLPNPQQAFVSYLVIDQTFGQLNGTLSFNNQTITGIASTVGLLQGMGVIGAGIPAGSIIQSVGANQITISQAATASAAVALTVGDAWTVEKFDRVITKAKWLAVCRKAR